LWDGPFRRSVHAFLLDQSWHICHEVRFVTDDPRYPIGRFVAPEQRDDKAVIGWRRDIAETPVNLRVAVAGLEDPQLDTPYREGGWTVRQLVHHVADSHLNAFCRFKLALTEENPVIKPYLEAEWAELADGRTPPVAPSLTLLEGLHRRWNILLESMTPADLDRTYFHPEQNKAVPLWRALALYSWHGKHHVAHITSLRARRGW
jgi:hypothetical protein